MNLINLHQNSTQWTPFDKTRNLCKKFAILYSQPKMNQNSYQKITTKIQKTILKQINGNQYLKRHLLRRATRTKESTELLPPDIEGFSSTSPSNCRVEENGEIVTKNTSKIKGKIQNNTNTSTTTAHTGVHISGKCRRNFSHSGFPKLQIHTKVSFPHFSSCTTREDTHHT